MTFPVLTAYTAVFLAFFQMALMLNVGLSRNKTGTSLGDGGDEVLLRKIRRHGNLTENAPIFLILLALLELVGGSTVAVLGLAIVFVVARLSHAIGLSGGPIATKAVGALGTIASIAGAAAALLYYISPAS